MKEFIMVLNDEYNQWYECKIKKFMENTPNLKKHPEKWNNFKFDLNQLKRDTVQITDSCMAISECPSRLQTAADIHCLGRTTVYDLIKKTY